MKLAVSILLIGATLISSAPTVEEDKILGNTYGPSIIEGNCTTLPEQELIFSEHIHKTRLPFVTRSATSTYYGDQVIYCIRAINQKAEDIGGNANITKGGVGHSFVTIQMDSYVYHGIEFIINIYGK